MPDDSTALSQDDRPHRSPVWTADVPGASGTRLVRLPTDAVDALAAGDLRTAQDAVGDDLRLTPFLVSPGCRRVWAYRSRQLTRTPSDATWVTRLVVAPSGEVVGRAGFHGAPEDGTVEIGYEIDPAHRRRGYARAALRILLDVARRETGVLTLRATISPDNEASRALVEGHGLVVTGEQWDEEDGLETIFEVRVEA
jgi:ribosomal-protein-alanine N-acetyltransferase